MSLVLKEELLPKKQFIITFSKSEWNSLHSQEVVCTINYKTSLFRKVKALSPYGNA